MAHNDFYQKWKAEHGTVSDLCESLQRLCDHGYGNYVVWCNDEYLLYTAPEDISVDHANKSITLGGMA